MINEEFEDVKGIEKWKKFGALLGGMLMIYLVTATTENWESGESGGHDHSHSHSSHSNDGIGGLIKSSMGLGHKHPDL